MVQKNVKKSLIKIKMMIDYETIAIKFAHPFKGRKSFKENLNAKKHFKNVR